MRRAPLPPNGSGVPQWVDLRGKNEITVGGRRGIQAISAGLTAVLPKLQAASKDTDLSSLGLTEAEMDAVLRLQEATVVAFVAGWSLDEPIPTLATVSEMPADLYDALSLETAKDGAEIAAATLDTSPGGDGTPDPKELSGASEPSDGPSKAAPEQSPPTLT